MQAHILVAGIGNVLMSDDAIGPYCAQHLIANYQFPPHVDVADLGTPGPDLALHLSAADTVLLIDALRDQPPGTITIYDCDHVPAALNAVRLETRSPALQESILMARLTGHRPKSVRVIGLAGVSFDHGTLLTPVVRAHIGPLIDAVLAELTALDVRWVRRPRALRADVWWEAAVR